MPTVDIATDQPAGASGAAAAAPGKAAQAVPADVPAQAPRVSVVMTVYNGERYLRAAVESILNQTFGDYELVVVDDGSTDRTWAMLSELAARDARIRAIRAPHAGRPAAMNLAIESARGEYMAPMDADDISLPGRLAAHVAYLDAHPDCVVVGGQVERVDPDGRSLGMMSGLVLSHEQIDRGLLEYRWPLVFGAAMVRMSAQRAAGAYDPRLLTNQDHEMLLRLAEQGRLANLDQPALQYRQHAESNLARRNRNRESGYMTLVEIVRRARIRRGLGLDVDAEAECAQRRAWWALQEHNRGAAWRHARALLRYRPFQPATWRLIACTIRGH